MPDSSTDDPDPSITIEVSDTQSFLKIDRDAIDRLCREVLRQESIAGANLSVTIVDNPTIHRINRDHLQHDCPTDVISFPLSDEDGDALAGELVISAEMACQIAKELGERPEDELGLYLVHGLLHLCGYDDHDDDDIRAMRSREQAVLEAAGWHGASRLAADRLGSLDGDLTESSR
jgi:probable rRNA maturation factor